MCIFGWWKIQNTTGAFRNSLCMCIYDKSHKHIYLGDK